MENGDEKLVVFSGGNSTGSRYSDGLLHSTECSINTQLISL